MPPPGSSEPRTMMIVGRSDNGSSTVRRGLSSGTWTPRISWPTRLAADGRDSEVQEALEALHDGAGAARGFEVLDQAARRWGGWP